MSDNPIDPRAELDRQDDLRKTTGSPIDFRQRAPDAPGDAPASLDVEEVELVKIAMSTSSGTPIVLAVPPDMNLNDIFEFIAFMAANEGGFRATFTEAVQRRQASVIDVSRGRLRSTDA